MKKIGIIGGSGLDDPDILAGAEDRSYTTPWGDPSSPLKTGRIAGTEVVLLARHGREHRIPPTQVNYRANIAALEAAGCTHILATTAVGSLREEIGRGDLVILDQFIDFTRLRPLSFHESFEAHKPFHAPMADPFSEPLRAALIAGCAKLGYRHHTRGTVVTIEGPRFSTRAESRMFRAWGADVINMSIAPEAILANEAGLPYAVVAMSTDYDCWKEDEKPVSWEEVLRVFSSNADRVTRLIVEVVKALG
jgi:5'-methylthioadenosine phosphorylase